MVMYLYLIMLNVFIKYFVCYNICWRFIIKGWGIELSLEKSRIFKYLCYYSEDFFFRL